MKEVYLLTVGKLKDKNLLALEEDYLKRIKNPKLKIIECKAYSEDLEKEAAGVLSKINDINKDSSSDIFLLAENGNSFDSPQFSSWLYQILETGQQNLIFVIGGASGHGPKLIEKAKGKLSLSLLTFPHKLARLLFVEQFYRAQTIQVGHPYHK